MKGRWVECYHPSSPGVRVTIWRPWWRQKLRLFATPWELRHHYETNVLRAVEVNQLLTAVQSR